MMAELPKDTIYHYESKDGMTMTITMTELVRCKDCKWHEDEELGMVYCPNIVGGWVRENFYCGDGEQKDEVEK